MVGDVEVLRRIYMVFQDVNWTARPWVISDERIFAGSDRFEITYRARGTFDAAPFSFEALLSGDEEGTVSFEVDGAADAPFWRNRLGLCVLHPMTAAGAACLVESTSGATVEARFPSGISPQQPFVDVRAITHEFTPGAWASVRLGGETYEMEDHRNWTDASFKTYCTPITLPFPVEVTSADSLTQSCTVAIDVEDIEPGSVPDAVEVSVGADAAKHALPAIGLQLPIDEPPWSDRTRALLQELALSHLRIDVHLDDNAAQRIRDAAARAALIDAGLVVALFVDDPAELGSLAASLTDVEVDSWLVFDTRAKVAGPGLASAARAVLGPVARIGGGTNLYFTELNREPPVTAGLDVVAFSMNPQVHATDNATIVQNLATQGVVASDARRLAGEADIHVGPVTLRPRFNPNATQPDRDVSNTPLPADVDARQCSNLGANWTIGSLKYLAEAGTVAAVTYFETTGWRGVMERDSGSALPEEFASTAGDPFPVLVAFETLVGFDSVRACVSNLPQQVDALLIENAVGERRLIVVSFADVPTPVRLAGFTGAPNSITLEPFGMQILDLGKAPA